jgi:hypothetical protein
MSDKHTGDASLIVKYKAEAVARRAQRKARDVAETPLAVQAVAGVVTVSFTRGAKPISELGGATKVLGQSRISIPEFKPSLKRS